MDMAKREENEQRVITMDMIKLKQHEWINWIDGGCHGWRQCSSLQVCVERWLIGFFMIWFFFSGYNRWRLDEDKEEEQGRRWRKWRKIRCCWSTVRYNGFSRSNGSLKKSSKGRNWKN